MDIRTDQEIKDRIEELEYELEKVTADYEERKQRIETFILIEQKELEIRHLKKHAESFKKLSPFNLIY